MKYIFGLLGIAVLFTVLNQYTKRTTHTILPPQATILAFGDSLTYGFGAAPEESYPSVLAAKTGRVVINAGINGETSQEGLRRLPGLLKNPRIRLMVLCFGGNDILQKLPKSQLKHNLVQMIGMAKERGITVLLLSVPDIGILGLSPLPLYAEVASETETPLLEGVLSEILEQPRLKSDQIHPNALGYGILAERVYVKLHEEGWI